MASPGLTLKKTTPRRFQRHSRVLEEDFLERLRDRRAGGAFWPAVFINPVHCAVCARTICDVLADRKMEGIRPPTCQAGMRDLSPRVTHLTDPLYGRPHDAT